MDAAGAAVGKAVPNKGAGVVPATGVCNTGVTAVLTTAADVDLIAADPVDAALVLLALRRNGVLAAMTADPEVVLEGTDIFRPNNGAVVEGFDAETTLGDTATLPLVLTAAGVVGLTTNETAGALMVEAVDAVVVVGFVPLVPGFAVWQDPQLFVFMGFSPLQVPHRQIDAFADLFQIDPALLGSVAACDDCGFGPDAVVPLGGDIFPDTTLSTTSLNATASCLVFNRIENFSRALSPSLLSIASQTYARSFPGMPSNFVLELM